MSRGRVRAVTRQCRLRRGKPGDRYSVWRAGHVIQTDRLAKADRRWIATMLATNAEFQPRAGRSSALGGKAHELADPVDIEGHERIALEDPEPLIGPGKARSVIARQAKDGLGQIIGAKAEKLGSLGDLASAQRRPRQLDHRADKV